MAPPPPRPPIGAGARSHYLLRQQSNIMNPMSSSNPPTPATQPPSPSPAAAAAEAEAQSPRSPPPQRETGDHRPAAHSSSSSRSRRRSSEHSLRAMPRVGLSQHWLEHAVCGDKDVASEMLGVIERLEEMMEAAEKKRVRELEAADQKWERELEAANKKWERRLEAAVKKSTRQQALAKDKADGGVDKMEGLLEEGEVVEGVTAVERLQREVEELVRERRVSKAALEGLQKRVEEISQEDFVGKVEFERLSGENEALRKENDERKREVAELNERFEGVDELAVELKKMKSALKRPLANSRAVFDGESDEEQETARSPGRSESPMSFLQETRERGGTPPRTQVGNAVGGGGGGGGGSAIQPPVKIPYNTAASMTQNPRTNAFIEFLLREFERSSGYNVIRDYSARHKFREYARTMEPKLVPGDKQTMKRDELAFWDGHELHWSLSGAALDRYMQMRESYWKE